MIVERGRRRVGGERDVGEEKRKMPPFQLPYSSNEMLTVEGSNRSKCMKPELVNCSLCGSCAIQHPSPVWTQSKAFLFGIISSPPNLTEAAQTASAPHFNMKVQNVFHIICSFSNACIFYLPPHREEVRNAIRRTDTGKECGKKRFKVAWCISSVSAPLYISALELHSQETSFCLCTVGEDVMLTYCCVLIPQLAAWLIDCWLSSGMTIWPMTR